MQELPALELVDGEHQAKAILKAHQAVGNIKKCFYVGIPRYPGGYQVECQKASFCHNRQSGDASHRRYDPHFNCQGCPKQCLSFKPRWIGRIQEMSSFGRFVSNRWDMYVDKWMKSILIVILFLFVTGRILRHLYCH